MSSDTKRTWLIILSPIVAVAIFFVLQFIIFPARNAEAAVNIRIEKLETQSIDHERRIVTQETISKTIAESISEMKSDLKALIKMHLVRPSP